MEDFPKKIILMGYMACGKSSVGRELAILLNRNFIDLDVFIAEKENRSITQLFEEKGEPYFRKKELNYLSELLNNDSSFVLSVGGGTPTFKGAIEMISEKALSIYLKASIQTLFERLVPEKIERPLLRKIPDIALQEYIAVHLFERSHYYLKANLSVSVDFKSTNEIAKEIVHLLNENGKLIH